MNELIIMALAVFVFAAGLLAVQRHSDVGDSDIWVTKNDLTAALQTVQPSAMREVAIEVPNVNMLLSIDFLSNLNYITQSFKEKKI